MTKKKTEQKAFFSSLKLTIPLLIVLAALSVIGTLITQNASEQEYIQRYGETTYTILKGLGVFNMYHSWWFIGVLILLAINIIACSWKRLPGVWQQVRKARSGYARLGTYLTHLSVLLILIGGLIGAVWGAKGYLQILEGETVKGVLPRKFQWMMHPLRFEVRCDNFHVDFYPNGSPKEFVSTLTFFEGERVVLDHVPLRVNHPVSYRGLNFYQSSYGISVLPIVEVKKNGGKGTPHTLQLRQGKAQPIPGTQAQLGFMQYREAAHGHGEAILLVLFPPDSQPEGFWLLKSASGMKDLQVGAFSFIIKDLEKKDYTVLEVVHDPGVPVVWVGCSLLVFGMVGTFTLRRPPKRTATQER